MTLSPKWKWEMTTILKDIICSCVCLCVCQFDRETEWKRKRARWSCVRMKREGDREAACCGVSWNRGSCAVVNEACSRKPTVWARCWCVSLCVCLSLRLLDRVFQFEWGELPNGQPCLTLSHACHLKTMRRWWEQGHWESFFFFLITWRRLSLNQITGADLQHAANKLPFLSFSHCLSASFHLFLPRYPSIS